MSSSKTTTNSTQNQTGNQSMTGSSTPTNPDWVTNGAQGLLGQIQQLGTANPTSYFAPASGNQTAQYSAASAMLPQSLNSIAQGAQMAGSTGNATSGQVSPVAQATAATAAPGISQYLNPFQQSVTDTTMAGLNQANKMALNDVDQGAELAGGYGGSRQGVAQGVTNNLFGQTAAQTLAGLNSQNYGQALGAANNDADRAQSTSLFNAGAQNTAGLTQAQLDEQTALGNQNAGLVGAGLLTNSGQYGTNLLGTTGATQQALDQQQAGAPLTVQQQLSQMFSGLPLNLFSGQNTTGTANSTGTSTGTGTTQTAPGLFDWMNMIGGNAAKAAGAMAAG